MADQRDFIVLLTALLFYPLRDQNKPSLARLRAAHELEIAALVAGEADIRVLGGLGRIQHHRPTDPAKPPNSPM